MFKVFRWNGLEILTFFLVHPVLKTHPKLLEYECYYCHTTAITGILPILLAYYCYCYYSTCNAQYAHLVSFAERHFLTMCRVVFIGGMPSIYLSSLTLTPSCLVFTTVFFWCFCPPRVLSVLSGWLEMSVCRFVVSPSCNHATQENHTATFLFHSAQHDQCNSGQQNDKLV